MLGMSELVVAVVVGGIIFLFGAGKVKEWIRAFKDVEKEYKKPIKTK